MKTILISGANRGLGYSLSEHFLQAGYRVFAGVRQSMAGLDALAVRYPGLLTCLQLDVTQMEQVRAARQQVTELTAGLDILINKQTKLEDVDFEDPRWSTTIDVNSFGPLRVTQQMLPLLEKGTRKLIINISSEAGSIADAWREKEFAYCMSKAALNMQTRLLHNYLQPRGFSVLAVHPGWIRSDMGGPEADISPDEAAAGIFALAEREEPGAEIYLDYQGKGLRW
jgi:NAD(P)-dependent dehydrogenase (short-subunit alcohol dehydrogenase family)